MFLEPLTEEPLMAHGCFFAVDCGRPRDVADKKNCSSSLAVLQGSGGQISFFPEYVCVAAIGLQVV